MKEAGKCATVYLTESTIKALDARVEEQRREHPRASRSSVLEELLRRALADAYEEGSRAAG